MVFIHQKIFQQHIVSNFKRNLQHPQPYFFRIAPSLQGRFLSSFSKYKPAMDVVTIPMLDDNYAYLLLDTKNKIAGVVDPVEPKKILETLAKDHPEYQLKALLTTHHHWDHSGGNEELLSHHKQLEVYGGDDRIFGLNNKLKHQQKFSLGDLSITGYLTPGHTTGHICFHVLDGANPDTPGVVFTGDTLFVGGCGRFFEGTPNDMYASLIETLGQLPGSTKVYCGHEYTRSNYKFAVAVDQANSALKQRLDWAQQTTCTIPSTIEIEMATNPFMRVEDSELQAQHGFVNDPIGLMGFLREKKNQS